MDPVLVACDACGARVRVRCPGRVRRWSCPRCDAPLRRPRLPAEPVLTEVAPRRRLMDVLRTVGAVVLVTAVTATSVASGFLLTAFATPRLTGRFDPPRPRRQVVQRWPSAHLAAASVATETPADRPPAPKPKPPAPATPPNPTPAAPPVTSPPPRPAVVQARATQDEPPRRVHVRNLVGRTVVARLHGGQGDDTHVMLPDGQLGLPESLIPTTDPFVPATPQEVARDVTTGALAGFHTLITGHYVVVYNCDRPFAEQSAEWLEGLYDRLLAAFRRYDVPVHDAEFPLVAVVFRTEKEYRAYKAVDPEIQAYYELYSNRIHFYQTSDHDEAAPEVAALRRPQTVAHEGTHQILNNIGVQPRLASWPPWLIEGLAEYCATPVTGKDGPRFERLGIVNAQHLATIRDMADPNSGQVPGATRPEHIGRPPDQPLVAYLVTKPHLSPTDYALAWAMTHYLAVRKTDRFVTYLARMSQMPPLRKRTPEQHLADFVAAFGPDLARLDRDINAYLGKLKVKDRLPYYAVTFEQRLPTGRLKRAAIVSQSPSLIRQWIETVTTPQGAPPVWVPIKGPSRTQAWVIAERWMREGQ